MCHHVHVTLSAEDRKDVERLSGLMIPVYASIVLALVAVVALTGAPPQNELIASATAPAAAH
jgi:NADH:ubiquinone oxidoreductase subunit 5 (subunit L)/multisubunit Na+/H+ antiporter MnhA subunit